MSKVIHKFPFASTDPIKAPNGRVVLVDWQQNKTLPTIWIEYEPGVTPDTTYTFIGTGHPVPAGEHVGSCICGPFVWHVYRTAA